MLLTALSSNRSPLYTSVSYWKCFHQCKNGHRWRVLCLNWDSASSTAYVPWDYRKLDSETVICCCWFDEEGIKRIDEAATLGKASKLVPKSEEPGSRLPPQFPHWQNSRALNGLTLKCLDSHSGWTADAILYIVRSLHHQVFLENLHALRLLATSHGHHRRFTLPAGSNRRCWAGATRKLTTLNSFRSDEQRMADLGEDLLCPGDYCVFCQSWVKNSTF